MIETARNEDLAPILELLRTQLQEHDEEVERLYARMEFRRHRRVRWVRMLG